jgi:hypothetical protein
MESKVEALRELALAVEATDLGGQDEIQAFVRLAGMTKAESVIFRMLEPGKPVEGVALREATVRLHGNLALLIRCLNARLAQAGDARRITCTRRSPAPSLWVMA